MKLWLGHWEGPGGGLVGEPPSTFRGAGESTAGPRPGTMRLASAVRVEGVVVEIAEAIERIRRPWRRAG